MCFFSVRFMMGNGAILDPVSGVRMSLMLILLLCSDCQDIETTLMLVLWGCNEPFSHTLPSVTDT